MKYVILAFSAIVVMMTLACGDSKETINSEETPTNSRRQESSINPADFSKEIDNPLFPLSAYSLLVYEGEETDPDTGVTIVTRVEMTVMPNEKKSVAGVDVLVVQDQAFENSELIESTLDYYAQYTDGSVYYFGEDVDNYEDGELKDHEGSWLAGEGKNQPGIIMPPSPQVGDVFEQEKAPGIAEDRMTVLSITESVKVPAGSWENCVKTEDVNPLDKTGAIEFKFYCLDIGFALEEFEEGNLELVSYE